MAQRDKREPTWYQVTATVKGVDYRGTYSVDRGVVTVSYHSRSKSARDGHLIAEVLLGELIREEEHEQERRQRAEAAIRARRAGQSWASDRGEDHHVEAIVRVLQHPDRDLAAEVDSDNPGRSLLRAVFGSEADALHGLWAEELEDENPGAHQVMAFANGVLDWWKNPR